MRSSVLLSFCLAGGLLVAPLGSLPAAAQSATAPAAPSAGSTAYVARATVDANFLEASARLALQKSTVSRVRSFARQVVREDVRYANLISQWADAGAPAGSAPGTGVLDALKAELDSGKLVPNAVTRQPVRPADAADLDKMATLASPAFDELFISSEQRVTADALQAAESYAASGDDPDLRKLARGEARHLRYRLSILEKRV